MELLLRRGGVVEPLMQLPAEQIHYVGGPDALFAAATAVASSNIKLPSGLSVHYEAGEVGGPNQTAADRKSGIPEPGRRMQIRPLPVPHLASPVAQCPGTLAT